jgi:hypothetical protein
MKSLRSVSSVLLLVLVAAPCEADETARLAALLRATGETSDVLGFLRGLRELGDVDLDRAEIRRAISLMGAPIRGPIADLLVPTRALRIRNGKVQISRSSETVVGIGAGTLKLGRRVQFQLGSASRSDTALTSARGVKVAQPGGSFYDLKKVLFTRENGRPVAKVTAGVGIFTRTVTVPLPEPVAAVVATAPRPEPTPATEAICRSTGLIGALGESEDAPGGLQVGDRGEEVADLQRKINTYRRARGLEPIDEDGVFGPGTDAAYREFQAACD